MTAKGGIAIRKVGHAQNAVKSQIWIAVSVYVLVAIIRKELGLSVSMHTLLQILSVTLFEKVSLQQTLAEMAMASEQPETRNQLTLFDS